MTKQEAIKTIETAIAEVEWAYPLDYSIAFNEAIKALKEKDSKAVKDWTLDKVRQYCNSFGNGCKGCIFSSGEYECSLKNDYPADWALNNLTEYTKEEKECADLLLRLFPQAKSIKRNENGQLFFDAGTHYIPLESESNFPNIGNNQTVSLKEILEDN
jgi:hypothetical protein